MKSKLDFIPRKPYLIIGIFLLFTIISAILAGHVSITDNNFKYLPEDSNSKTGIEIFTEEFVNVGTSNSKVLITDKTVQEVLDYKEDIKNITGVDSVLWIDDYVDLNSIPIEFIPVDTLNLYHIGDDSLLSISFVNELDSKVTKNAISEIDDLLGSNGGVGFTTENVFGDAFMVTIFSIIVIMVIIVLFSYSYFESFLILVTLGVAVLLNYGSNIIFGEVSEITFAAGAIIQLAVSIDYSLIFINNFNKAKKEMSLNEAIKYASRKSFTTITAGALTTMAGFLALTVMDYKIGFELGLVLAKGILFSFLAANLLLPALIKISIKLIDKTEHKPLIPSLNFLTIFTRKRLSYFMLVVVIILAVFGFIGQEKNDFKFADPVYRTPIDEQIVDTFGEENNFIILIPKGDKISELAMLNEISEMDNIKSVANLYLIAGVNTPYEFIPDTLKNQFESEDYSLTVVTFDLIEESEETFETVTNVRIIMDDYYDENYLTGSSAIYLDIKEVTEQDYLIVILLTILSVFIIIALTFRSLFIPFLLVFVIQSTIWINMSIPYYQGNTLAFIGFVIVGALQLGATIDYAILLTEHYNRARVNNNKYEAVKLAISHSSVSIVTSMLALSTAGFSLVIYMDSNTIKELGTLVGRGSLLSGMAVLILLPSLLILFDRFTYKKKTN